MKADANGASRPSKGDQLIGRYGTHQEETFFDDRYTADLTFDVAPRGNGMSAESA